MKKLLFGLFAVLSCLFILSFSSVMAAEINAACDAAGSGSSSFCQDSVKRNPLFGPTGIITKVINLVSMVAGAVAVFMIIIGGVMYILSHGDSSSVKKAHDTLLYAIIGLFIVIMAQAIVRFVLVNIK